MGEKDTLNKLRHSVQFPIHPCDIQVETTLRRQAAFLSPTSPAMCKAVCLQGGHEQFLGPPMFSEVQMLLPLEKGRSDLIRNHSDFICHC